MSYETFLYFHAGNKIGVYKSNEEINFIEPNEKADPTFNLSTIALLELYKSLREEMIRVGLLARDLHEKERALVAKHLDDAIKTRDSMMKLVDKVVSRREEPPESIMLSATDFYTKLNIENAMSINGHSKSEIRNVLQSLGSKDNRSYSEKQNVDADDPKLLRGRNRDKA